MVALVDLLRFAQTLILVFGTIVVYTALRGYARKRSASMLLLAIGFGFVTSGAVAAGVLFELVNADLIVVQTAQAASQATGFFLIVYSLVATRS